VTDRPTAAELTDRLALAIIEHGPTAGSRLALIVGARKEAVLRELRSSRMFESTGRGRGSKWRLAGNRTEAPGEPLGTDSEGQPDRDLTRRLDTLERRLAEVERQLAKVGAPIA
jgi:hypothetical protein